jgi:SAM-dependent methyltransferase
VGCGSGLHALAALRLGAAQVTAIDIDPVSVRTAQSVLGRFAPLHGLEHSPIASTYPPRHGRACPGHPRVVCDRKDVDARNKSGHDGSEFASTISKDDLSPPPSGTSSVKWTVDCRSIVEATPENLGRYDIVYSWGVLHHTGALREALSRAATLVKTDGLFAVALYRRTPFCGSWRMIKRWYSQAGRMGQSIARTCYIGLFALALLAQGRYPKAYLARYKSHRGMDFHHNVHDWLGGYPYESIAPDELTQLLAEWGFREVHSFRRPPIAFGIFGSHCDEYLFTRSHS